MEPGKIAALHVLQRFHNNLELALLQMGATRGIP